MQSPTKSVIAKYKNLGIFSLLGLGASTVCMVAASIGNFQEAAIYEVPTTTYDFLSFSEKASTKVSIVRKFDQIKPNVKKGILVDRLEDINTQGKFAFCIVGFGAGLVSLVLTVNREEIEDKVIFAMQTVAQVEKKEMSTEGAAGFKIAGEKSVIYSDEMLGELMNNKTYVRLQQVNEAAEEGQEEEEDNTNLWEEAELITDEQFSTIKRLVAEGMQLPDVLCQMFELEKGSDRLQEYKQALIVKVQDSSVKS